MSLGTNSASLQVATQRVRGSGHTVSGTEVCARGRESLPAGMRRFRRWRSPVLVGGTGAHTHHPALRDMSPSPMGAKPPKCPLHPRPPTLTLIWESGAQRSVAVGCATWCVDSGPAHRIRSPIISIFPRRTSQGLASLLLPLSTHPTDRELRRGGGPIQRVRTNEWSPTGRMSNSVACQSSKVY